MLSLSNSRSCHVLQEKIIVCFAYIYTPFPFSRLKQKMDLLLFLIKKHLNNTTVRYNDTLAHKTFINKNKYEAWHAPHAVLYAD